jgi:hypothetical protein
MGVGRWYVWARPGRNADGALSKVKRAKGEKGETAEPTAKVAEGMKLEGTPRK